MIFSDANGLEMTMMHKALNEVAIREIRVVNPRTRHKLAFEEIVKSIAAVGLKKPITVTHRSPSEDGTQYDLVCGQGRMEACETLGYITIPANVIEASSADHFVMSLVENIARRPPSSKELFREIVNLKKRGYSPTDIATKLGRDDAFIKSVNHLIDKNAADLVAAVESNRIPLSIALVISSANEPELQQALSQAYESGELRGFRLREAKRLIASHTARRVQLDKSQQEPALSGRALVREYQRRTREQQALVNRASQTRDRLLLLKSAMKTLLADGQFVSLLRAENLQQIPAELECSGDEDEPTSGI